MRLTVALTCSGVVSALLSGPLVISALAQDNRGYVAAAVAASTGGPEDVVGSPGSSFQNASDDGSVLGGVVELGVKIGRLASLSVEALVPQSRAIDQSNGRVPFRKESAYREAMVFGLARVRLLSRPGVISPEIVAGGGVVFHRSRERVAPGRFTGSGNVFDPFGPEREVSRKGLGATAGFDIAVRLSPELSVVPELRFTYVDRGDIAESPGFPSFGLPTTSARAGVGVRLAF